MERPGATVLVTCRGVIRMIERVRGMTLGQKVPGILGNLGQTGCEGPHQDQHQHTIHHGAHTLTIQECDDGTFLIAS